MGKQKSNDEWKGWCVGGVWEAFLRVGGRLQMTKICVFCWLFHSNGRRETERKGKETVGELSFVLGFVVCSRSVNSESGAVRRINVL